MSNVTSVVTSVVGSVAGASISPVTLSEEWPRLGRLLLLVTLAVLGCVGNVFLISAIIIEDFLKKLGNSLIVNIALADLLVTGVIMPVSAVVLLAGAGNSLTICKVQWYLAELCFLINIFSIALIACENFMRLRREGRDEVKTLSPRRATVLLLVLWVAAGGAAFAVDSLFDYCTRSLAAEPLYRALAAVALVLAPALAALFFFIKTICRVRASYRKPNFKPPVTFKWDYSLMKTNLYSFVLFVIFWLPFGIVLIVGSYRDVPDRIFYNLAWVALGKSCVNNFLYCILNRHFRHAYVALFHYCCCKTSVSFGRRGRGECSRPSGDVRVHIIPGYNMYSYTSPQRSSARDSYEL